MWRRMDDAQTFLKNIEKHRDRCDAYDKLAFEELDEAMRVRKTKKK